MPMLKKLLILLALDVAALMPGIFIPAVRRPLWTLAVPAVLLVVLIVTLLWPSAGLRGYFAYRTPVVVAAFCAELWILAGGLALQIPSAERASDWWFQGFLVVFFLLTCINALPGLAGEYRSQVSLRPDLIFGGGAYLVRGEIFAALGVEFLTTRPLAHPVWNWWAVVAEIAAMLILIAFRGVLKMRMRRARFLGADTWLGAGPRAGTWVREGFLSVGLFFVVYAFASMYLGRVPFTWPPGEGRGPGWAALAWLAASLVLLVPVRGWWKTRLPEPPTRAQEAGKQLLLWAGLVVMIYGFVVLSGGRVRPVYCCGYFNFWWGVWVSVLGLVMLVPLRVRTLREEFRGTVQIMTAGIADFPDSQREQMLRRRLAAVAALGERERSIHLGLMIAAVEAQPPGRKHAIQQARHAALGSVPAGIRERLDSTSSRLLDGGTQADPARAARQAMT